MLAKFSPPYDSPIEECFAWDFLKNTSDDVEFISQYPAKTDYGHFILDFVAVLPGGRKIGFECDGKEFDDASRDEWRDSLILGERHVDSIYRFRGCDLICHIEDLLYAVSKYDPKLFSQRGLINLQTLSSPSVRNRRFRAY